MVTSQSSFKLTSLIRLHKRTSDYPYYPATSRERENERDQDSPTQIIPDDKLPLPRALLPPEHPQPGLPIANPVPAGRISKVGLGRYTQELVDKRATPGVLLVYVVVEILVCARESKKRRRVEEGGDVGE